MINILKYPYWSKADAFLLPLTGLKRDELGKDRTEKFPMRSYLFWDDYTAEDFNLVLTIKYDNYDEFVDYCNKSMFPILDKKGYLVESHDFRDGCVYHEEKDKEGKKVKVTDFTYDNLSIFVLDLSEWALDIEMFLKGKYSKLSKEARELVENFHQYFVKGIPKIPPHIHSALNPTQKRSELGGLTYIEYVAKNYEFDLEELNRIGELAGIYEIEYETLTQDCNLVVT